MRDGDSSELTLSMPSARPATHLKSHLEPIEAIEERFQDNDIKWEAGCCGGRVSGRASTSLSGLAAAA